MPLKPETQLQPHQQAVFDEAGGEQPFRKLLLWSLGSGKGLGSVAAAESIGKPYTIVAPAALRQNYLQEQEKFTDRALPSDILSYTALAKGRPTTKTDTVVFDEIQRARNVASKQSQRSIALAQRAKNLILLTGTPLTNRPSELAPLISMLSGTSITPEEFDQRYVGEKQVSPGIVGRLLGVTPGTETVIKRPEELKALLRGHVDYFAPPKPSVPVKYEDVVTEMTTPQTRLYKAFWDQLPWVIRWKLKHDLGLSDEELRRAQAFLTGPRQVGLSTYPFLRNKDPEKAFSQSSKLNKAFELLSTTLKDERAKAIVYSNYIDAGLRPYASALTRAKIPHAMFYGGLSDVERKKMVEDFNEGRSRVALVGPAGSEGISLKGSQLLQILDPHWAGVRTNQAIGRGIRFDSHTGLPEDLQNITVQRFISRLPLGFKDRLLSRIGFDRESKQRAADDYLRTISERKEQRNQRFMDLLKSVGSEKYGRAPGDTSDVSVIRNIGEPAADPGVVNYDAGRRAYDAGRSLDPGDNRLPDRPVTIRSMLRDLRHAKTMSDARHWSGKYSILLPMMAARPHEWIVDSDLNERFVGVTHEPTGWRFHLPREAVPPSTRRLT